VRVPRSSLDILAAVIAVAEGKTLDKAAAALGLSTASAVHKRIRAACTLFEAELFFSTNDGLALTEEGQTLYEGALHAVGQTLLAEERVIALMNLKASRLLIGHCTYLPPKLLAAVLKIKFDRNQDRPVQLQHFPGFTETVIRQVAEGKLHVGFGYLPVQNHDLLARVLYEEQLVVAMSMRHPLAVRPALSPLDLAEEPFIAVFRHTLPWMHDEIERFFSGFGIKLPVVADAFGPPEAMTMVENRLGICLVGVSAAIHPGVVMKPLEPRVLTRRSGLFVREENHHTIVKAFIDKVLETMEPKPKVR
jgi:DNA-binding transcriptional LysR family regulator